MVTEKRGPGRPRKSQVEEEAQTQLEDSTTEEIIDLEEGTDPSALYADSSEHVLELQLKGKKWTFYYRDMTWGEKSECIDAAQIWGDGDFKFSIFRYYAMALQKMLVRSPIRPMTETTLQKLSREVGEALISIVPTPVEESEVQAIKKA
jgi:hypothetical protein